MKTLFLVVECLYMVGLTMILINDETADGASVNL